MRLGGLIAGHGTTIRETIAYSLGRARLSPHLTTLGVQVTCQVFPFGLARSHVITKSIAVLGFVIRRAPCVPGMDLVIAANSFRACLPACPKPNPFSLFLPAARLLFQPISSVDALLPPLLPRFAPSLLLSSPLLFPVSPFSFLAVTFSPFSAPFLHLLFFHFSFDTICKCESCLLLASLLNDNRSFCEVSSTLVRCANGPLNACEMTSEGSQSAQTPNQHLAHAGAGRLKLELDMGCILRCRRESVNPRFNDDADGSEGFTLSRWRGP